jgi:hypothetical protein
MKYVAIVLVTLVVLALAAVGIFWRGAQLEIVDVSAEVRLASGEPTVYGQLLADLQDAAFDGAKLQEGELGAAGAYQFVTYSVRLRNNGLLPAEWIQLQIHTGEGDAVLYNEPRSFTLSPSASGNIARTVLMKADADVSRVASVTYYVYGHQFSIDTLLR